MTVNYDHITVFKVRRALGLSQREFGAILGMSGVNVHYIEKGEQSLADHYIAILRNDLGLDAVRVAELVEKYDAGEKTVGAKARALHKIEGAIK